MRRVRDMICEITAATGEQSNSLVEVDQALAPFDQMTQQNFALVERAAAESESLNGAHLALGGEPAFVTV